MFSYLLVFLAAFGCSLALTPAVRRVALRWGMVAEPGGRRRHSGRLPRLGGLPLLAAYGVGVALIYWQLPPSGDDAIRLRGVVLGTLVMVVGGLIDDRWELPAWPQFLIQAAGAAVAMAHIIFIEVYTNPFTGDLTWITPRLLALAFTLFWILAMINAVNWLDGLDGLATGVGAIAALLFAWHGYRLGQTAVAAFPLALAGALLGLLPYNFSPARIFLGTAGAYFLGYNLATLAILSPAKIATALLVLAVPILDWAWQIFDRLRQRRSPFRGDRGHLHFRLADRGVPVRWIVLGYYGVAVTFGLVAIFATGLTKVVILVGGGAAVLGVLVWLTD